MCTCAKKRVQCCVGVSFSSEHYFRLVTYFQCYMWFSAAQYCFHYSMRAPLQRPLSFPEPQQVDGTHNICSRIFFLFWTHVVSGIWFRMLLHWEMCDLCQRCFIPWLLLSSYLCLSSLDTTHAPLLFPSFTAPAAHGQHMTHSAVRVIICCPCGVGAVNLRMLHQLAQRSTSVNLLVHFSYMKM